jgi:protein-disulfide isomerase
MEKENDEALPSLRNYYRRFLVSWRRRHAPSLFNIACLKAEIAAKEGAKPAIGRPGAEPPHIRGSPQARVTLEEFGDFECAPCGMLSPILEQLEKDYGERLRVIFREFPLAMHKHAMDAARAAEAAGLQGHFWEMHDILYHNRYIWPASSEPRAIFNTYAETLKLDLERFKKDVDGEQVTARIRADKERTTSLKVDRTPVLFINDHQLPVTAFNPQRFGVGSDGFRLLEKQNSRRSARTRPNNYLRAGGILLHRMACLT